MVFLFRLPGAMPQADVEAAPSALSKRQAERLPYNSRGTIIDLRKAAVMAKEEKPDLAKKVHEVPHKPGVYLMRDRFNRVIYVGKARDLRKRVGSYFMPSKL